MKLLLIFLVSLFLLSSCCKVLSTSAENQSLYIQIRKSDDISLNPNLCDGDITINSPRGADVSYSWSHTDTLVGYEASQLCNGMYFVTITKGNQTRVSQVIIN